MRVNCDIQKYVHLLNCVSESYQLSMINGKESVVFGVMVGLWQ